MKLDTTHKRGYFLCRLAEMLVHEAQRLDPNDPLIMEQQARLQIAADQFNLITDDFEGGSFSNLDHMEGHELEQYAERIINIIGDAS